VIERRERLAVLGITALALLSRLTVLWQPMRFDEGVSWAYYVGRSWWTIVGTYKQPNNHVFYSLLAKLSAAAAAYPPWALRLPALLAGVAIIPLTWAVGRRFADDRVALLAAALSVGSTQLMLYSTNARGYTLFVALFLAMLLVADRIHGAVVKAGPSLRSGRQAGMSSQAQGEGPAFQWMALTLLGAIGLYTIPIMLYPLGVVSLWLALAARRMDARHRTRFLARVVASFVGAIAIAGILYIPIIRSAGLSALLGNKFVAPSPWDVFFLEIPGNLAATLGRWTAPLPWWCTPLMTLVALLGMRRLSKSERPSLVIATGVWCVAVLLGTHRAPFYRVWLFLLPLFLLSVSRGLVRIVGRVRPAAQWRAEWPAAAVAVASLALAVSTHAVEENDDTGLYMPAKEVAALLAPRLTPNDRVLAPIPPIGPLLYYFPHAGADTVLLTRPLTEANRAFLVLDKRSGQTLEWAVRSGIIDPAEFPQPILIGDYKDGAVWEVRRK
jgi:hypothetical protein